MPGSGTGEAGEARGGGVGGHDGGEGRRVADDQVGAVCKTFVVGDDQRAAGDSRPTRIGIRAREDELARAAFDQVTGTRQRTVKR